MRNKPTNKLLYDAIKDRGTAYLMVFRELKVRYGEDEARDVMRSASRAHGLHIGKSLTGCAPRDFECMAKGFAKSPDDGSVFSPDIRRLDSTCLEVKMMACPIKDAWVEAGCSEEEIVTLLYCASALDEATLEAAGFDFEIELWSPGQEGCCLTRITEKTAP
ncbi:L-2-amino-thiazoline-4-carboxylic acid hydrolase [Mesorhizobium sp. IMUNJ 23232]|uniref:L-2-amino-thiazoline-4-carboxylic acid hydrolase n=1 Tax=Mesorhizobium sp. IMUNJ 23232 TaxID=3376064 RepID=UPI0037BAD9FE